MGYTVFQFALRGGHLVVGGERQLVILQVEDGISAPVHRIGCAAARLSAAAPLVGEEHLGSVVAEVGGVPEGVVRIGYRVDAHRVHRVGDVQQDSVARACTGGESEVGTNGDIVAAPGHRCR